ncbi:MAG: hypothetical protein IPL70_17275 [Uliginosibacterium sp.]|nr:hypothetical protein [Uliginosibacterium sp.]
MSDAALQLSCTLLGLELLPDRPAGAAGACVSAVLLALAVFTLSAADADDRLPVASLARTV